MINLIILTHSLYIILYNYLLLNLKGIGTYPITRFHFIFKTIKFKMIYLKMIIMYTLMNNLRYEITFKNSFEIVYACVFFFSLPKYLHVQYITTNFKFQFMYMANLYQTVQFMDTCLAYDCQNKFTQNLK